MTRTDVFTEPSKAYLAPNEKRTIEIDFANELAEGVAVASASARIVATLTRIEVAGAVVSATIDGTTPSQINVAYDATDLLPGVAYRLETSATIAADDVRVFCTDLEVV